MHRTNLPLTDISYKHFVEHLRNHKKTPKKIEKRTSNFSHVTVESTLLTF